MNVFQEILIYILDTIGMVFLLFVILRFLLQLARADFYNPLSQAIQKITNPLLRPIRKVIPGLFGIDLASIVLALMTQLAFGEAVALALYQTLVNPLSLLIWGAVGILNICTYIGIGSIIILVISSFVAPHSTHPIIVLAGQLLEPILRPARKLIPPVGGLDFSVMLAGMGIFISQKLIYALAVTVALQPKLIIGF